jgi:hypothetical protein
LRPLAQALLLLLAAHPALAYDVEISSETIGQGYQVLGGDGALIDRRRLDQYLGLSVWNLGPKDAFGVPTRKNQFYFTSSMRFETDFGNYPATTLGTRDVSDELRNNNFDLLFAYLGARDLAGFLDLKLGRQVEVDQFQWVAFDGLSAEAKTRWFFAVSAYGGVLADGALPIDSPVYRPDGTAWKSGDHLANNPADVLSVHDHDWKPTVGVAVRSFGFRDLDVRLSYHHTFSPAQHDTADEIATHATDGTSEEKLAFSARGRLLDGTIVPWFGMRYDLLNGDFDQIEGGARVTISPRHALSVQYLYSYPTFDGDSIWNLFVRSRYDDLRLGYDVTLGPVRAYVRAFGRLFYDDPGAVGTQNAAGTFLDRTDAGANLGAQLRLSRGYVRADGYAEMGYGGRHAGVDVASRMRIWREILFLEGRATYAYFLDDSRPLDSGHSFGVQLGARVQFGRGIALHVIGEDNVNSLYNSQLRFYAVLDLAFLLGSNGFSQALPRNGGPGMGQFGAPIGAGY